MDPPRDTDPSAPRPAARDRWLAVDDAFLRPFMALPELAVVAESCPAERRLHERLAAAPQSPVTADELAAVSDADARANYATFLDFRDAVVGAGTLEAYYLAVVGGGRVGAPPLFVDRIVEAIVSRLLGDDADIFERRAAQLLYRAQRVAIRAGRVVCADRDAADRVNDARAAGAANEDEAFGLAVLGAADAHRFGHDADPRSFALDLTHEVANDLGHGLAFTMTRAHSGQAALARVLERWIDHFLAVRTTIRPLQRIDDPAWRWHIGLDVEASAILNDLYRGEAADDERLRRLIGLFRLDFANPLEMRADVAGKPVYLGLATSDEQTLKLKPQNLLVNLPLAVAS